MIEKARVTKEVEPGLYEIELLAEDGGHCASCSLESGCAGKGCQILAVSSQKLQPGALVRVDVSEKNEMIRVFWVFLFPLIVGITAAALVYGLWVAHGLLAFAGFSLGFMAAFFMALGLEKRAKKFLPRILVSDS